MKTEARKKERARVRTCGRARKMTAKLRQNKVEKEEAPQSKKQKKEELRASSNTLSAESQEVRPKVQALSLGSHVASVTGNAAKVDSNCGEKSADSRKNSTGKTTRMW